MSSTCLANPSCMASPSFSGSSGSSSRAEPAGPSLFAQLLERLKQVRARYAQWRQTRALSSLDAAVLEDVGAPHWLKLRNQAHHNLESYEHFKAVSRLKY